MPSTEYKQLQGMSEADGPDVPEGFVEVENGRLTTGMIRRAEVIVWHTSLHHAIDMRRLLFDERLRADADERPDVTPWHYRMATDAVDAEALMAMNAWCGYRVCVHEDSIFFTRQPAFDE